MIKFEAAFPCKISRQQDLSLSGRRTTNYATVTRICQPLLSSKVEMWQNLEKTRHKYMLAENNNLISATKLISYICGWFHFTFIA